MQKEEGAQRSSIYRQRYAQEKAAGERGWDVWGGWGAREGMHAMLYDIYIYDMHGTAAMLWLWKRLEWGRARDIGEQRAIPRPLLRTTAARAARYGSVVRHMRAPKSHACAATKRVRLCGVRLFIIIWRDDMRSACARRAYAHRGSKEAGRERGGVREESRKCSACVGFSSVGGEWVDASSVWFWFGGITGMEETKELSFSR